MSNMTTRIAHRSRKTAKKTSKRIVLYVPDTFDAAIHLPEALRHLADYARFLLHRINVGRVHLRKGNCLVYLKHDYLARFMPRGKFTMIREALEEAEVISVRKFCVPGELCFGYRLCPFHDQGFSHYQPTTKPLINKIKAWRAKEFRDVRLPLHRDLRRFVKAITIDETAALRSVHGRPFEQSAQFAMIQRIVHGDFFTVADRFGRFHTNLTNLKASLRPFLRYRDSHLVNLDLANSQPMVFCLLLVNLLSNEEQLENLIDYSFPETSNPHFIDIDQDYLDSLSSLRRHDDNSQREEEVSGKTPFLHAHSLALSHNSMVERNLQQVNSGHTNPINHDDSQREGEPWNRNFPILSANLYLTNCNYDNLSNIVNSLQNFPINQDNKQEVEEGGSRNSPILHANGLDNKRNIIKNNNLQQLNNRQPLPADVIEFIDLCERGILYDDVMRRLDIPPRRRGSFKRLFFSQVFFGKIKTTGRVRELFAREFPTVFKAINDLKRKDHRKLAYLLQAHESKIMIDIICRRILEELPGTFIATIHDSIMTTPDKADEVRVIMLREFQRFGLNPTIRLEAY
jgi:hypothetical protein